MAFYDNYINRIRDTLQDNPFVIEMKSRYSGLDPKSQQIINVSVIGIVLFIILFIPLSLFISTYSLKSQIRELEEATEFLNYTASEIQELRQIIATQAQNIDTSISPASPSREIALKYLTQASVREDSYAILDTPDSATITLTKISIRQVVKLLYALETSPAGLDVVQADVDTKSDPKGYIWSTITFRKKQEKKPVNSKPDVNKFTRES